MFIYKFMAGLVDSGYGGGPEETSFDPHLHRVVAKPTTYSDTMIHMLKGCLGVGVLAMPEACKRVGIFFGVLGTALIGLFACYCLNLLILAQYQLCKKWKRGYIAYAKSMKLAVQYGPKWLRWTSGMSYGLVESMLLLWQIGISAIYVVFVSVNIQQICGYYNVVVALRLIILYMFVPMLLLNLIKDLKLLTPVSTFSNAVTILGMLFVFFYLIEDDVVVDSDKLKIKSLEDIPLFIGTVLFSLEAVGVVLALEYNMENPARFTGPFGLLSIGMIIILTLYMALGVAGYVKYGEHVESSITLNLPSEQKKAQCAKVLFAIAIFCSFPLQNFVAYEILLRKLKKKLKPGSSGTFYDYGLRVLLVLIPFGMALAAPNLGAAISLLGALCLSLLGIVFPAIIDACVWYPDRYGPGKYKLWRDIFIVIAGMVCLLSGVYTSIGEFAKETEHEPTTTSQAPEI